MVCDLLELGNAQTPISNKHKEDNKGMIGSDDQDKRKIQMALSKCIHPLEFEKHASDMLVNIHSGEESTDCVNVNEALRIGSNLLSEFQESLPSGFRKPLYSKVMTMTSCKDKKKKKNCNNNEFNTDLLFSRVFYLLGTHQINFENIFDYELAPVPTSLF